MLTNKGGGQAPLATAAPRASSATPHTGRCPVTPRLYRKKRSPAAFSVRNLRYMRKLVETIADEAKVQTLSAQLSQSRNAPLLNKAILENIVKFEVGT